MSDPVARSPDHERRATVTEGESQMANIRREGGGGGGLGPKILCTKNGPIRFSQW